MTIGDLIQQLTVIMKDNSSAMQVKLGSKFDSMDDCFDSIMVSKPISSRFVYIIPTAIWEKSGPGSKDKKKK